MSTEATTITAILMAGGEGIRLRPLTETTPKPMLKVGGVPLLEILLGQLVRCGFRRAFINVRYLREQIEGYFGNGAGFNMDIMYLQEPEPYGTAGGLSLIPRALRPTAPFLVLNADLLTPLDFGDLWRDHCKSARALTLVGRPYPVEIPFGYPVLTEGGSISAFQEKPTIVHTINSGMYCLNPDVLDWMPAPPCDMPDVIRAVMRQALVGMYRLGDTVPFHEIGTVTSYCAAEKFYEKHMR